jgi:large subunit ribosomal protein L19
MSSIIYAIEAKYRKHDVVDVRSGDTVKVHQKIKEGNKERIQVFEGLVIRTDRKGSHTSSITVRRIASGIGVEKTYLMHSPLVEKIEVTKRSKVRRNYLTYMRSRTGKSARLSGVDFDKTAVNTVKEAPKPVEAKEEATNEVNEESKES